MYFADWDALKAHCPVSGGPWDKEILYEYLVYCCNIKFSEHLDCFFDHYRKDEALAGLLFDFLLDDYYDGSDSQMGAAHQISRMDREVLRKYKDRLLEAQKNEVLWKRPFFREDSDLEWL